MNKIDSGLGFLLSLLLTVVACSTNKPETEESVRHSKFIYRDSFLIEHLSRTMAYCRESNLIDVSRDIPEPLIRKWLRPFSIQGGAKNKMLSYQFNGSNYHSVLLLVVGDQFSDSLSYKCYDTRQYLVTVGDSGDFIDGFATALTRDHRIEILSNGSFSIYDRVTKCIVFC